MKDQIIEFQNLRIQALEAENTRLKNEMIRKESSLKEYLNRLSATTKDLVFQKPIHNLNYDSISTVPGKQN